jgi:protein involved in sex pheromone biosynthesis
MKFKILLTALITFILISGCGKKDESTDPTTPKQEDRKQSTEQVPQKTLPPDFPSDIPMYKDAKILGTTQARTQTTVTFEITDRIPAIADFYQNELKKAGYESDSGNASLIDEKSTILAYKKGGKTFNFMYNRNEEKSVTHLNIVIR